MTLEPDLPADLTTRADELLGRGKGVTICDATRLSGSFSASGTRHIGLNFERQGKA